MASANDNPRFLWDLDDDDSAPVAGPSRSGSVKTSQPQPSQQETTGKEVVESSQVAEDAPAPAPSAPPAAVDHYDLRVAELERQLEELRVERASRSRAPTTPAEDTQQGFQDGL